MNYRVSGAAIALALAFAAAASSASAGITTWTLQGVTFNDGGTASGAFDYNDSTGQVSAWDFTTTAGSVLGGFHYTTADSHFSSHGATDLLFLSDPEGRPYLRLAFDGALTGIGPVALNHENSYECSNCFPYRLVTAGSAVSARAGAVPEPAAWALMISGFGLAGSALRRRRVVAA